MVVLIVLLAVAAALLFFVIGLYNRLVALKHRVATAWSNIDVLLKQRHDELPKLVETCRQYMKFERETLERVIAARGAVQSAREAGDLAALGTICPDWTRPASPRPRSRIAASSTTRRSTSTTRPSSSSRAISSRRRSASSSHSCCSSTPRRSRTST